MPTPDQRLLIDKIRIAMQAEAPVGVFAIEHGDNIHLPAPRQRSWIEICPGGPFNRWRCTEYRADCAPVSYIAENHWQITAWLIMRWRGVQPNTPARTNNQTQKEQACHA